MPQLWEIHWGIPRPRAQGHPLGRDILGNRQVSRASRGEAHDGADRGRPLKRFIWANRTVPRVARGETHDGVVQGRPVKRFILANRTVPQDARGEAHDGMVHGRWLKRFTAEAPHFQRSCRKAPAAGSNNTPSAARCVVARLVSKGGWRPAV